MGLSMSEAIRMFLKRTSAEHALPFEVRVPNAETKAALEAVERGEVYPIEDLDEWFETLEQEVAAERC